MPYPQFDRAKVNMKSLSERENKQIIEEKQVSPDQKTTDNDEIKLKVIAEVAKKIKLARKNGKSIMMSFGAHSIKNCLSPVFIKLMEDGWLTHLATNGAGIIHDWEFSYQGKSSEDVELYASQGQFGNWQETGFYLNTAISIGAYEGKGYGEAVGCMIENEELNIPSEDELINEIKNCASSNPEQSAAAADLLKKVRSLDLPAGNMRIPHKWKHFSVQGNAYKMGIPFTSHPMFGHDIIYNHQANNGAAIGRAAERDFLTFAENVKNLDGGVYLSIGSAVMSPMIFEKSISIARNVLHQEGKKLENHHMLVVDLAESHWDWTQGEPPEDNPDYYLRFNKTFSRMGGTHRYLSMDNRDFLLHLVAHLKE